MTANTKPGVTDGVPYDLGAMPVGRAMETVDERVVGADVATVFSVVAAVEEWPAHLAHYRFVRMRTRRRDGGGLVEMSANRPFGPLDWPTWWLSEMQISSDTPAIRFRHVGGITKGMEVEWRFDGLPDGTTRVRLVHAWGGPRWPIIGVFAATEIIGPVFIHGIASRTLEGLARTAERLRDRTAR